jgi:hypothetical protein
MVSRQPPNSNRPLQTTPSPGNTSLSSNVQRHSTQPFNFAHCLDKHQNSHTVCHCTVCQSASHLVCQLACLQHFCSAASLSSNTLESQTAQYAQLPPPLSLRSCTIVPPHVASSSNEDVKCNTRHSQPQPEPGNLSGNTSNTYQHELQTSVHLTTNAHTVSIISPAAPAGPAAAAAPSP